MLEFIKFSKKISYDFYTYSYDIYILTKSISNKIIKLIIYTVVWGCTGLTARIDWGPGYLIRDGEYCWSDPLGTCLMIGIVLVCFNGDAVLF